MLTKEKVLEVITDLPEEFSIDDLVDKLIILNRIDRGLLEIEKGRTIGHNEAKEKMKKWLR